MLHIVYRNYLHQVKIQVLTFMYIGGAAGAATNITIQTVVIDAKSFKLFNLTSSVIRHQTKILLTCQVMHTDP